MVFELTTEWLKRGKKENVPLEPSSMIKKSSANTVLNFCDGVAELFGDGLTLKSLRNELPQA